MHITYHVDRFQTESSLYYTCIARNREYIVIFMHVWSTAPGQACLSLFGGVCSQMLPPSNYFYIHLSARLDVSPAFGCLNQMAKGTNVALAFHVNSAHAYM